MRTTKAPARYSLPVAPAQGPQDGGRDDGDARQHVGPELTPEQLDQQINDEGNAPEQKRGDQRELVSGRPKTGCRKAHAVTQDEMQHDGCDGENRNEGLLGARPFCPGWRLC